MKPDVHISIQDSIKNRALNDYTADKVQPPKPFIEPKKTAMNIGVYSPGMKINLETKQQGKEAD